MGNKIEMRRTSEAAADAAGVVGVASARSPLDTSQFFGDELGSIDTVRDEIRDAFAEMRQFFQQEPDEVMRLCSGHSARMSEIRVLIQQIEVIHRQWRSIRVNEVEPVIEELRQQYLIASRLLSVRELDWKMTVGKA